MYITITELLKENLKDWNENTRKTCDLALIKIFSQEGVRGYLSFLRGSIAYFQLFYFQFRGGFSDPLSLPPKDPRMFMIVFSLYLQWIKQLKKVVNYNLLFYKIKKPKKQTKIPQKNRINLCHSVNLMIIEWSEKVTEWHSYAI